MSDFQVTSILKARKQHRCCECAGTILPGQQYQRVFGVWEGNADAFKTCLPCVEARDWATKQPEWGGDAVVICSEFVKASNAAQSKARAPKRIYLSGPMTGLPAMNYPAFNAEAARLRALGYHVENPAENPPQDSWDDYMAVCIPQMRTCDTIALLPGWSESRGALRERQEAVRLSMAITPSHRITGPAEGLQPERERQHNG